jgi:hypothetical protein
MSNQKKGKARLTKAALEASHRKTVRELNKKIEQSETRALYAGRRQELFECRLCECREENAKLIAHIKQLEVDLNTNARTEFLERGLIKVRDFARDAILQSRHIPNQTRKAPRIGERI